MSQWRVEVRQKADEDRQAIFDCIAADNVAAALDLDDLIEHQLLELIDHPELYRVGRVRGMREMVLAPNYILVYRILKQAGIIEVVRIIGARQNYPKAPRK